MLLFLCGVGKWEDVDVGIVVVVVGDGSCWFQLQGSRRWCCCVGVLLMWLCVRCVCVDERGGM